MINARTLKGALSRKRKRQLVIEADNPCGFIIKSIDKAKDADYTSLKFFGVYGNKVTLHVIRREIDYQNKIKG